MDDEAILSSNGRYTWFKYGGTLLRFMGPKCLEKYIEVKEWDNCDGYLVVTARYSGKDEEEYIDLFSILNDLCMDAEDFLSPIKRVRISYESEELL